MESVNDLSIGQYLIRRLQDYGIADVFGIPGDYVLNFYSLLEQSPINVVGCTREDCAGFAADAYARVKGMGAVCVTYCGATIPPETTILMPSSTVMLRVTNSRRGTNNRYPEVGFGVVGRNTLTTSSEVRLWISPSV